MEAIAAAVPAWAPEHPIKAEPEAEAEARAEAEGAWLRFDSFDMGRVLRDGAPLRKSDGGEFDEERAAGGGVEKPRERLLRQRKMLQQRLGMESLGDAVEGQMKELLGDADLKPEAAGQTAGGAVPATRRLPAGEQAELVVQQLEASGGALSARARAQAKRKAKQSAKALQGGGEVQLATSGEGAAKRQKTTQRVTEAGGEGGGGEALVLELVPDGEEVGWEEAAQWPFEPLCAELRCSLFHASWPRRHGAAAGLRAVLKSHGGSAGVMAAASAALSAELQAQWQADCAIRLLCLLALDRFGDWASGDKVTAPVRETAAQALSVLLRAMGGGAAAQAAEALLTMQARDVWEVRHGAMLGLKYLLAVRADLLPSLLPRAAPIVMEALLDRNDDVRCVAAEGLLGVAAHAEELLAPQLPRLLGLLWDSLLSLDDLTPASTAVMALLAEYCRLLPYAALATFDGGGGGGGGGGGKAVAGGGDLGRVVPRLWGFVHHPSSAARVAALRALERLLGAAARAADAAGHGLGHGAAGAQQQAVPWLPPLLGDALRLLLQARALDPQPDAQQAAEAGWQQLLRTAPAPMLAATAAPLLPGWLRLLSAPSGAAVPTAELLLPPYLRGDGEAGGAGAASAQLFESVVISPATRERGAAALGALACACGAHPAAAAAWMQALRGRLQVGPAEGGATARQAAAWVVAEWAAREEEKAPRPLLSGMPAGPRSSAANLAIGSTPA